MKKQEEIKKNKKQRGENVEEIIEIHVVCFKAGLDARGYLMSQCNKENTKLRRDEGENE